MAIQSFSDKATELFFIEDKLKSKTKWSSVRKIVKRKLDMVDYAADLKDLKSPPGNRLEALKGDLRGYHSIRVNDQWRIIFRWMPNGPCDVRVEDYH